MRRTRTDPIVASKEWIEDAKIHLIRNCSLKYTVKYQSQDCRGRGGGIRLQGDGAQLSRWRRGTLKWILGGSDVSFSSRANPDTRYTLRVVFRVCQYATPRYGHQKTKANPRSLDYSIRNEINEIRYDQYTCKRYSKDSSVPSDPESSLHQSKPHHSHIQSVSQSRRRAAMTARPFRIWSPR